MYVLYKCLWNIKLVIVMIICKIKICKNNEYIRKYLVFLFIIKGILKLL